MPIVRPVTILRSALGAVFVGAGIVQATNRTLFRALVPRVAAGHEGLIQGTMTGVLNAIGAAFLVPRLRPVARWGATTILAGSLPLAVDQVRRPAQTDELGLPRRLVVARVGVQIVMLALALAATRRPARG